MVNMRDTKVMTIETDINQRRSTATMDRLIFYSVLLHTLFLTVIYKTRVKILFERLPSFIIIEGLYLQTFFIVST